MTTINLELWDKTTEVESKESSGATEAPQASSVPTAVNRTTTTLETSSSSSSEMSTAESVLSSTLATVEITPGTVKLPVLTPQQFIPNRQCFGSASIIMRIQSQFFSIWIRIRMRIKDQDLYADPDSDLRGGGTQKHKLFFVNKLSLKR